MPDLKTSAKLLASGVAPTLTEFAALPPDEQAHWYEAAKIVKLAEIAMDAYVQRHYDLFVALMEELGDDAPAYMMRMAKLIAQDEEVAP